MILLAAALVGCGSGAGSREGHNGNHDHDHEGHDHEHEHVGHENHNHENEGHNHGHEYDHDHEGHNHNHAAGGETGGVEAGGVDNLIVFTRDQAEAAGLEVETVARSTFSRIIKTGGQIESSLGGEAVVAAPSSGVVSFVGTLAPGAAVGRGQTVATIRDPEGRNRVELEAARREYHRAEELVGGQIISEREWSEAKRRYEAAQSASEGPVPSPLAGYVKNLLVAQGEYVATGQPVAIVAGTDRMQLRAEVPERHLGALSTVTGANFRTAYGAAVHHADRVLSYGRAVEGGYVPVTLEFANVGDVVAGAFVDVWLLGGARENVVSVPKGALSERQGLYFVYVRLGEEDFAEREVSIGAEDGERVEIVGGLESGETVVTRGTTHVRLASMSGIIPEGHSH